MSYDDFEAVNATLLKKVLESLRAAKHYLDGGEQKSTKALDRGIAAHSAVLEPDTFEDLYIVQPAAIKARRGHKWDDFVAANPQKRILTQAEHDQCLGMRDSVWGNVDAAELLGAKGGLVELPVLWAYKKRPEGSIQCKSRLDFLLPNGYVADLKTTQDCGPRAFGRAAHRYKYDLQAAFYVDAAQAAQYGSDLRHIHIAVEPNAPYDCAVYDTPREVLDTGRARYELGLELYLNALSTGDWFGKSPVRSKLQWPEWDTADDLTLDWGDE